MFKCKGSCNKKTSPHNSNYVVSFFLGHYTTSPSRSIFLRCSVPVVII